MQGTLLIPDRVVIIGLVGTLYENGLYEFDVGIGPYYPRDSPGVIYRAPHMAPGTTPCIPLLNGTAMIRGEPLATQTETPRGGGARIINNRTNPHGHQSTYTTLLNMISADIVPWAENPPQLWWDVVKLHFKKNGHSILRAVERWVQKLDDTPPKIWEIN
ncbi:hypothetical protein BU23DRAFT_575475 [Bimuria novae-zelandiae CBS 107.79]|uniref:Uncharacterized protein n=1 Tax=Bimuria novae-zelandiae CBS 107.79 TaxID=1447943 RepID=A0A6A5UIP4_9PLEO|nr:hypothetical protein BU23DRAFT_575475 [Bimuria novae-zelandiae CBS 107.79]